MPNSVTTDPKAFEEIYGRIHGNPDACAKCKCKVNKVKALRRYKGFHLTDLEFGRCACGNLVAYAR